MEGMDGCNGTIVWHAEREEEDEKKNQKKTTSGNDKKFDDFIISIAVGVKSK